MYYLAVDIGASSGRHLLGWIENGEIRLEEVWRFSNGMTPKNGRLCWDHERLVTEIIAGMKKCAELGKIPSYMGIDTWGVDFLLLDGSDRVIGDAVGYRDGRTAGMDEKVYAIVPEEELYARTGIQKQICNTVYQLMALRGESPEALERAESFLMMPDYLNFCLTGVKHQEYTIGTTAQMIDVQTGEWDLELIERLGYPTKLFGPISMPKETVGRLRPEIVKEIGYDLTVLHPASHDTASAVLAVPTNSDQVAYISSGTWSLMGVERLVADSSPKARLHNFTNEGGVDRRYRFLKNIMGLWMIQSIRRELNGKYSFSEMSEMAEAVGNTPYRISVNDDAFFAPESMIEAVRTACGVADMPIDEVLCCVYHGLADCYAETMKEIEEVTGAMPEALHIIGGGSRDEYLNRLTARAVGVPVYTGPTEATAIGNILCQMLATGEFSSVAAARDAVFHSFDIKKVEVK